MRCSRGATRLTGGCQCGAVRYRADRANRPARTSAIAGCARRRAALRSWLSPACAKSTSSAPAARRDLSQFGHRRARFLRPLRHAADLPRRQAATASRVTIGSLDSPATFAPAEQFGVESRCLVRRHLQPSRFATEQLAGVNRGSWQPPSIPHQHPDHET